MSDAGGFIDEALRRESSWIRAEEMQTRLGGGLRCYGSSVGAIRGTVRDALRRHPGLPHDEVTALSSELWEAPVFELRLSAIVLLQSNVHLLTNTDLTRLEGFVREGRLRELVDPLAVDVVGPLIAGLDGQPRVRAEGVLDRWTQEPDEWLRRAALMSPLRALCAGGGDWDAFVRRATTALDTARETGRQAEVVREGVHAMLKEVAKQRPELQFPGAQLLGKLVL
ncbi:DNA alkylation repair protein [Arthrobacter sp. NPDC058127]|uniref:DNA alkylation repair protein n=1 Tax=Arthrobacter sp. NPDC058127 TaxID=3346351 RepID=UPI0036F0151F